MKTEVKTSVLPDPTDRPTLTVEQAASYLGVSRGSAYKAVERGEIPSIQIGKRLLVPTATLRQLLGLDQPDTAETVSVAP